MQKECTKCHEVKPLDQYCKSSKGKMGVQPACKACMNVAYTASRKKKQQHYQDVAKKRKLRNVEWLKEYKAGLHCVLCFEEDESCFDFHHTDPATKDGTIADLVYGRSTQGLLLEIEKCVILCANCHRKVHAGKISLIGA